RRRTRCDYRSEQIIVNHRESSALVSRIEIRYHVIIWQSSGQPVHGPRTTWGSKSNNTKRAAQDLLLCTIRILTLQPPRCRPQRPAQPRGQCTTKTPTNGDGSVGGSLGILESISGIRTAGCLGFPAGARSMTRSLIELGRDLKLPRYIEANPVRSDVRAAYKRQ
ncbi:hypothetical protein LY76DRAFT_275925, partial [Colletotrichum caudatum]